MHLYDDASSFQATAAAATAVAAEAYRDIAICAAKDRAPHVDYVNYYLERRSRIERKSFFVVHSDGSV